MKDASLKGFGLFRQTALVGLLAALCLAQTASVSFTISTIAGNGTGGFAGDAGTATSAELNVPSAVAVSNGNIYIADQANHRIRMVQSGGTITTIAGNGTSGFLGDSAKATDAELNSPSGVAVNSNGDVYFSDTLNNRVRKVSGGNISTVAGPDPDLIYPAGLAFDSSGNLFIADSGNNGVKKLASGGGLSIIAGTGGAGFTGTGGAANKAQLNNPLAVAISAAGDLYIADTNNNVIRMVKSASATGTITIVAGGGTLTSDGASATLSQLNHPKGVVLDSCGNLYIADSYGQRIRMVTTDGKMYTVAGTGSKGYSGDSGAATSAQLNFPTGIAIDSSANLYVADSNNHVIRQLTLAGASPCGIGKPKVGGVITAGNFGASTSAASGSWIEIYGTDLAASTQEWTGADFSGINAPTALGRTSVKIGLQDAFVRYVSPQQVNVQVPANLPTTVPQLVTVTTAAGTSAGFSLTINATQPGLFAPPVFTVGGKQYVGATHLDGTWVMPTGAVTGITSRPAKAGETIVLYGVGFGSTNPNVNPGQITQQLNTLVAPILMKFGSTPAVLNYWGLAPQAVGLYQFNVVVPVSAGTGTLPVTFTLNGVAGTQTLYTELQ